MKALIVTIVLLAAAPAFSQSPQPPYHTDLQRQAEVAKRSPDVMPFSLAATTHIFTKKQQGGVQLVIAKDDADERQIALVRAHLQEIREQFLKGDFSGPAHIHGADMPGLASLKAAERDKLAITYREVKGGAELEYESADGDLVAALHQWFNAQLADHGSDAMAGHHHHH
jgi:hypothetical protein